MGAVFADAASPGAREGDLAGDGRNLRSGGTRGVHKRRDRGGGYDSVRFVFKGLWVVRAETGGDGNGDAHQGRFPVGAWYCSRASGVGHEANHGGEVSGAGAFSRPRDAPRGRGGRNRFGAGQRDFGDRGRVGKTRGRDGDRERNERRRDGRREFLSVAPHHARDQPRRRRAVGPLGCARGNRGRRERGRTPGTISGGRLVLFARERCGSRSEPRGGSFWRWCLF